MMSVPRAFWPGALRRISTRAPAALLRQDHKWNHSGDNTNTQYTRWQPVAFVAASMFSTSKQVFCSGDDDSDVLRAHSSTQQQDPIFDGPTDAGMEAARDARKGTEKQ